MAFAVGTTTSTTMTSTTMASTTSSTTTTTVPGGCTVDATYDSILCRIDALIVVVQDATDLGRFQNGVLTSLQHARKQAATAQAGKLRTAKNQLKKSAHTLDTFRHKLDSLNAKHVIPADTRSTLRAAADDIRTSINTLRGTL